MANTIEVPIIDVAPLIARDEDGTKLIVEQIQRACRSSGFFYISNHGIDLSELQRITDKFHQTITPKEKFDLAIHAYNSNNNRSRSGYYMAIEGQKANESFCYLNPSFDEKHPKISAQIAMHEVNVWPEEDRFSGIRGFYEKYYWSVFDLASLLLTGFAISLGKESNFFEHYFTRQGTLSAVSLIRYPYLEEYPPRKIADDGRELSFERHQDVSLITILYQTPIPNLQVLFDGEYHDIPTSGDYLLVNCGTYMEHITNGYFPAPWHRVAYINAERLSIPFFVNLDYESTVEPFVPWSADLGTASPIAYGDYFQFGFQKLIKDNGQT